MSVKKILIKIIFFIVLFSNSCKFEPKRSNDLKKYNISEFRYLTDYISEYSRCDTMYVDSFNILYESLKVFNVNDTNLVYANFFNNSFLLNIRKDSIDVYRSNVYGQIPIPEINNLLEINDLDSAISIIEKESTIIYKYKFRNLFAKIISINKNSQEWYFLAYHQKDWINWSFSYCNTIKNDFLTLGKIKYLNSWPYNIDSLKLPSPKIALPLKYKTNN